VTTSAVKSFIIRINPHVYGMTWWCASCRYYQL